MYIYLNGNYTKKEDAKISPFDHGFLYGVGLFETLRVYNGHPFLLDDHLKRLNHGLEELNIKYHFNKEETNYIIQKLLENNHLMDAYVRINISAGQGDIGLQVEPYTNPTIIIFIKPLEPVKELAEKTAVLLKLRRNTPEGVERLKSHHFLNNILAKREIGNLTANHEGIFLTEDGYVAEGIVSNVFWKKGNVLYTPDLSTGILNGITREFVIELAKNSGLSVKEGLYKVEQLLDSDEIFVTNSIQEIVPIYSFEDKAFPGKRGHLVQLFYQEYRKYSDYLWSRYELIG
ncbi:MAG: 4-amino-4-deoxychorismate lyase [Bacillales bacterium]|jgi:4-amino-4-deoxychorismate lyase|nr:4-amino-4-deoxychorismate lyase [Bacillales bacterium]